MVSSLAIIVLERKDHAEALVLQEAQALQSMQRETDLLAPENRKVMRAHLLGYLNAIIDGDWPSMRQARWQTASRASAAALWSDIVEHPVTNYSQMNALQFGNGFGVRDIAIGELLLCIGFHPVEEGSMRWTAGRVRLPATLRFLSKHRACRRTSLALVSAHRRGRPCLAIVA